MSRIYAVREDNDERFLHRIKCDSCDLEIPPDEFIKSSGWMRYGALDRYTNEKVEWEYCPNCDSEVKYRY